MEEESAARLGEAGLSIRAPALVRSADVRYGGQDFTLQVALPSPLFGEADLSAVAERFAVEHRRRFGYVLDDAVVLVNLRVSAVGEAAEPHPPVPAGAGDALKGRREVFDRGSGRLASWSVYERRLLEPEREMEGPAVVEEPQSTHLVPAGDGFHADARGNLFLKIAAVGG
jgi:N-methylhydantoinase A